MLYEQKLREFVAALSVCHTVMVQKDETSGQMSYRASSPDEGALVTAAKLLGCEFVDRGATFIRVKNTMAGGEERIEEYQVKTLLAFLFSCN